jgi:porphobilinogen synthase
MNSELNHILQGGYFNRTLRDWQSTNTNISQSSLILPLFIHENDNCDEEIPSLPDVRRLGVNNLHKFLEPIVDNGLKCVLLFGVIDNKNHKDSNGSFADHAENPVVRAIPLLKKWFPELMIACDVCLCAYTDHGHCGIFNEQYRDSLSIDLSESLDQRRSVERIASVALGYARAGADIVAPR